jgi:DNA-binding transcriptional ArsR family regulator
MTLPKPKTEMLPLLVDAAKALGHPTRLRILAMLRSGGLCVCQLTAVLGLAASTVSGHLAELRGARLVREHKQGKWVTYSLADDEPARLLLEPSLRLLTRDSQARQDAATVRRLRTVPLETLCQVGLDLQAAGVIQILTTRRASARPTPARRS